MLGIVPNFNITYLGDNTVSLTAGQKLNLAFHSVTDPVAFVIPFVVTGYHEARDDDKGFPWGIKGLGERSGAAYLDAFDGNMIGNGILPAILHQDSRYYRWVTAQRPIGCFIPWPPMYLQTRQYPQVGAELLQHRR